MSTWSSDRVQDGGNLSDNSGTHKAQKATHKLFSDRWVCFYLCLLVFSSVSIVYVLLVIAGLVGGSASGGTHEPIPTVSITDGSEPSATVPQYFQTSPELYAGPTATALVEPFLAQTNPAPFGTPIAYGVNQPLQTQLPVNNLPNQTNIFHLTGQLSPYFPGPGFGANEYPLPPGTNITAVNVLHRHGSRYPTEDSSVSTFGSKIFNITRDDTATWSGALSFLKTWEYSLGSEILTNVGHQELFDSGVLHFYNYGALYNKSTRLIARTTTQDRMLKSAQYFMAGFFGLDNRENVSIEVQIEMPYFNTSLAGYLQCPNSYSLQNNGGNNASATWANIYLRDATARLRTLSGDYEWTVADSYDAQTLCPYETVAFGYSPWCGLFTYEEWQGFEYSIDLQFHGGAGFGSPAARGVGIGYVQEFFARLQGHLYDLPMGATQSNYTLATMESTFPTNQTLYFDFSHDTNIMSVIAAFGLRQFAETLPPTSMPENRSMVVSHLTPFGARMVWEVIHAPQPVKAQRPGAGESTSYNEGDATTYIHLLIGQRTVPLYRSYPACEVRDDGWCDMRTFMEILNTTLETARYEYSCFGDYPAVPYGNITDGVPITKRDWDTAISLGGRGSSL